MIYLIIYHLSHQRKRHQLLSCHAVNIILWNPKCRREEITQHGPANINSTVNNRCYETLMENNPEAMCPSCSVTNSPPQHDSFITLVDFFLLLFLSS